ncbi:hypothetical protein ABK040_007471 [Willaertia magna]
MNTISNNKWRYKTFLLIFSIAALSISCTCYKLRDYSDKENIEKFKKSKQNHSLHHLDYHDFEYLISTQKDEQITRNELNNEDITTVGRTFMRVFVSANGDIEEDISDDEDIFHSSIEENQELLDTYIYS